ncbi:tyrosine-type recombinase/integrase [Serratia fonticola]|uniref:tyrosine-type recombinase/integrase n=1 Tax=Serratia fonticola TaxID=47917 RepID=UPI00192BA214|nr:integrase arm-type DNA-binding domain-containing protein [Serratia fonticola]
MSLSDTAIRNAKPSSNPYKLPDERGLFLLVHPNGSKYWRQKYRYEGKEKTLAHGVYPEISLKDAPERRESARKLLAQGVDPSENKKAQRAARQERATNSFEVVAREWFETKRKTWASSHADKVIRRLENNIFPWLGGRAIAEITAPELLACIRRIEKRGVLETAHRALENCGQVYHVFISQYCRRQRKSHNDFSWAHSLLPGIRHRKAMAIFHSVVTRSSQRFSTGNRPSPSGHCINKDQI